MTKLCVVTACYYSNHKPIDRLTRSAHRHRLVFRPYGVGHVATGNKWPLVVKVKGLRGAVRNARSEYVLYVDGTDALIVADEAEIMEAYEQARDGHDILIGSEMMNWPYPVLKSHFDSLNPDSVWRYPCPGILMGTRDAMVKALTTIEASQWRFRKLVGRVREKIRYDDQGMWALALVDNLVKAKIDTRCRLGVSLKEAADSDLDLANGRITLLSTGTKPCVLHCNGHRFQDRTRYRWMSANCR